jgi:hypothetical protein
MAMMLDDLWPPKSTGTRSGRWWHSAVNTRSLEFMCLFLSPDIALSELELRTLPKGSRIGMKEEVNRRTSYLACRS